MSSIEALAWAVLLLVLGMAIMFNAAGPNRGWFVFVGALGSLAGIVFAGRAILRWRG